MYVLSEVRWVSRCASMLADPDLLKSVPPSFDLLAKGWPGMQFGQKTLETYFPSILIHLENGDCVTILPIFLCMSCERKWWISYPGPIVSQTRKSFDASFKNIGEWDSHAWDDTLMVLPSPTFQREPSLIMSLIANRLRQTKELLPNSAIMKEYLEKYLPL